MFPFKTKEFSKLLEISAQDFENNLVKYAQEHPFISLSRSRRCQATLNGVKMDRAISEIPMRNSFKPEIIFEWKCVDNKTSLTGYYKLSDGLLAFFYFFLVYGIIVTIKERSLYPLIFFLLLWSFIFQVIGYLLFRKEFDWVKGNFEDIIYEVVHGV